MPSNSLSRWNRERAAALDEIENAHLRVGGTERGRRYATQQINFAYVTLLSSQFQGYCRDLHSESIDYVVAVLPTHLQGLLRREFLFSRNLERGNPHPGAIGSDFMRLGIDIWAEVYAFGGRNQRRRVLLEDMIRWRNAIAHQDFGQVAPAGTPVIHLSRVRAWRRAIGALAEAFDRAMRRYLSALIGTAPW